MDISSMLVTIERDETFTLAWAPNLFIVAWRRQPDVGRARVMTEAYRARLRSGGSGAVVAVLIEAGVPPPDAATRKELDRAMRLDPKATLGIAYVLYGDGFGAAAMRSVVTGTLLLARPPYPARVFANEVAASPWILQRRPIERGGFDTEKLCTVLRSTR